MPPRRLSGAAAAGSSGSRTQTASRSRASKAQNPEDGRSSEHPTLGAASVTGLYRGRKRLALLRDLALGDWTHAELAQQNGLPTEDITAFAQEYQDEVQEIAAALAGKLAEETAGLWISKKHFRIAELQQEYEDVSEALLHFRDRGSLWSTSHKDMVRAKLSILRAVAEELGAYPQRTAEPAQTGNAVHYIIETDDADALR